MTDANAVIRHARVAVDLVLNGAVRRIESELDGDDCNDAISSLFNAVVNEALDWDVPGTLNVTTEKMIDFVESLQAWLDKPDCPPLVRELLANHGLLP